MTSLSSGSGFPGSGGSVGGGSPTSGLHTLCKRILGPGCPEQAVQNAFRESLQLLSSSSASSSLLSSSVSSWRKKQNSAAGQEGEMVVAEKIKKKLVREGRPSDAARFSELHSRLQSSSLIRNRESLLTLFLHLSERPQPQGQRKVTAPFVPLPVDHKLGNANNRQPDVAVLGGPPGQGSVFTNANLGKSSREGRNTTPIKDRMSAFQAPSGSTGGFHPPLPPKPRSNSPSISIVHANRARSESPAPNGVPATSSGTEKELLRELIYAFQGIEGRILRRNLETDRYAIADAHRRNYSVSETMLTLRLAELGWLFSKVNSFCENLAGEREVGLVAQSLISALKNELAEYYRLLSTLEAQHQTGTGDSLTLLSLSVWTLDPTNRLKLLVSVVDECKGLRGGALVSAVYRFLSHGDPALAETAKALLKTVCQPMYLMVLRWLCDGSLEDPFGEFFIASDPRVQGDAMWAAKYELRIEMVPSFLGENYAKRILATGKSINFLREVCHESGDISGRDVTRTSLEALSVESLFTSNPKCGDSPFHHAITRAYKDTSSHVLSILFTRYKFLDHLTAMRKYLLLGQGDIIRYLLELLEDDLSKPATTLYPHNLAGSLETAIRATNAQYEDPEILDRLDVRLWNVQSGDTGWDVFTLDYKVTGPIGTVMRPQAMNSYHALFNHLWRGKRIEYMLSCVWKRQAALHKMIKILPELKPILHLANLLTSEMIHFIHQLAYYTTFEVMECSWDLLIKHLRVAESLDEVIDGHEEFLNTLLKRALLDETSSALLDELRSIYNIIINFQNIQNKVYLASVSEWEARTSQAELLRVRERKGGYGMTEREELEDRRRRRRFEKETLEALKQELKCASQSYQNQVQAFLLNLAHCQDQALQFLSFRLDFNGHYKKRNSRLGAPLRFQHLLQTSMNSSVGSIH